MFWFWSTSRKYSKNVVVPEDPTGEAPPTPNNGFGQWIGAELERLHQGIDAQAAKVKDLEARNEKLETHNEALETENNLLHDNLETSVETLSTVMKALEASESRSQATAKKLSIAEATELLLKCPMCKEFKNPTTEPATFASLCCSHCVCTACVMSFGGNVVQCPVCNKPGAPHFFILQAKF